MSFRAHPLDGAMRYFERKTGTHVRLEGPAYANHARHAPAVVQLGLTNRCNLRCSFCFRERGLASTWTAAEIVAWAAALAAQGVLELGFGQGEPLVFPGFPALVRSLADTTPLAINFTTNGLRLDDARLDDFDGRYDLHGTGPVGQVQLSCYDDNDPLARVRLLTRRGVRFGVSLLVTPARLAGLRATIEALAEAGCRDLLLLSYNGPDHALHLAHHDDRELARIVLDTHVRHGQALRLRLSICLGRRLPEVPQLRLDDDCGAGDDFVTIDSEKRLLPCSFHAAAIPVSSPQAALAEWRARRDRRSHAGLEGCARPRAEPGLVPLSRAPARTAATPRVIAWQAFASNHSTSFTLVGEFSTSARSAEYVAHMEALLERCSAAVAASREGTRPLPRTLGELLGHDEPYDAAYQASPIELSLLRPPTLLAGGRRVLVHDHSTLHDFSIFAHQLLRSHGRILWTGSRWWDDPTLVFGIEAGDTLPALAATLTRHCQALHARGPRLYGVVRTVDIERVAPILRPHRRAIACVHETDEDLAAALDVRSPAPARKRRTEWVLIGRLTLERWHEALAELGQDPAARLARAGWPHPFRMPDRLDAFSLLDCTIVRSEGAPFPAALQAWLHGHPVELVAQPRIRLRAGLRRGSEDEKPPFPGLTPAHVAALSRPGGAHVVEAYRASVDILPRNPAATFAQLHAILGREPYVELGIMPEQPLADALARIEEDLDALASSDVR